MNKRKISKLLLIGIFTFSIINVYAIEENTNDNNKDHEILQDSILEDTIDDNSNDSEKHDGLVEENGKKYYYENDEKIYGFKKVGEDLYFFSSKDKAATQGWKAAYGNVWYQDEEGKVVRGFQIIDNKKYYFNEETGYQEIGFKKVGEDLYFFSSKDKSVSPGWKAAYGNVWYQDEEGKVVKGLQIIENKKYYFNEETGYQEVGFKKVGEDLYFFSSKDKTATQGWKAAYGNIWYQDENGIVLNTGWHNINGKKYYVNDRYILRGKNEVDTKYYYFDDNNGELLTGWININEKTYYSDSDGSLVKSYQTINEKEYYFDNDYEMVKGLVKINNKSYYYNNNTGEKMYGKFKIKENKYETDSETGEVINIQYIPIYYNQKDFRWANMKYGSRLFGNTGCAPTSMAMAFTSILEREILPPEVGNYLYYETNEYNKKTAGTSGLGIIYASNKYNIKLEKINSKSQLITELNKGHIIFAAMANGKFATKNWNHAILVYDLDGGKVNTISADPLNKFNNGFVPIDTIWEEQSKDADDIQGGAALYSLLPTVKEITE